MHNLVYNKYDKKFYSALVQDIIHGFCVRFDAPVDEDSYRIRVKRPIITECELPSPEEKTQIESCLKSEYSNEYGFTRYTTKDGVALQYAQAMKYLRDMHDYYSNMALSLGGCAYHEEIKGIIPGGCLGEERYNSPVALDTLKRFLCGSFSVSGAAEPNEWVYCLAIDFDDCID